MAIFRFKQFAVQQDRCAMKLGTDGVLLGAWADVAQASSILDIGTGTGVLALMAAQRNAKAKIHAIELDAAAAAQAKENCENSPWADRLLVLHQSLQTYTAAPVCAAYDVILSNPPYYPNQQHSAIQDPARALARQTQQLDFSTLLQGAGQLLSASGRFSLILPIQEGQQFIALAKQQDWYLKRYTAVVSRQGKAPNRCLIELVRASCALSEDTLVLRQAGPTSSPQKAYTKAFRQLHQDFLLFL